MALAEPSGFEICKVSRPKPPVTVLNEQLAGQRCPGEDFQSLVQV